MIKKKFNRENNEEIKLLSSEVYFEGGAVLTDLFKYSLEEHIVGTWIDGKPIYRKIIHVDKLNTKIDDSTTFFPFIMDNIDEIITFRAIIRDINTGDAIPVPFSPVGGMYSKLSISMRISVRLNEGAISCEIPSGSSFANKECYANVIAEYTKTTDIK